MMDNLDRYSRLAAWAKARYQKPDGALTRCVGPGIAGRPFAHGKVHMVPSRYSLIEEMAAARYLGVNRRWPDETLATAYAA